MKGRSLKRRVYEFVEVVSDKDVELTLEVLAEHNLVNHVAVVKDGVEAMDYLRREGKYKHRKWGESGGRVARHQDAAHGWHRRTEGHSWRSRVENAFGRHAHILPRGTGFEKMLRTGSQRLRGQTGRIHGFHGSGETGGHILGGH